MFGIISLNVKCKTTRLEDDIGANPAGFGFIDNQNHGPKSVQEM